MERASPDEGEPGVKIRIGGTDHLVDTQKIPYFGSFLNFQSLSGHADRTCIPEHKDIPHFETISAGVNNGFRQFFRRMPTQLSEYQVLCETLEFLAVDVLGGRDLKAIMDDLRKGIYNWDIDSRSMAQQGV